MKELRKKAAGIRAAFFDIDGTLLDFGKPDLSPAVRQALLDMKKKGIRLFLATGRPPYILPAFAADVFDGALCFNGGFCYDKDGPIYSHPLDLEDVQTVIANAKALGLPAMLAAGDKMGSNFYQQELEDFMMVSHNHCDILEDYDSVSRDHVYQMMLGIPEEKEQAILAGTKNAVITRWWDKACDVIPKGCGKAHAIEKVLEYYGFTREQSIAFGDGGNDRDMIEYAGIGVAMGNAKEEVKASADYVTASVAEDGVPAALTELGIL